MFWMFIFMAGVNSFIFYYNMFVWEILGGWMKPLSLKMIMSFLEGSFTLTVLLVVFHAFIFTMFYMPSEKYWESLIFVTSLFVGAMYVFISSNSIMSLFIGWDGLGISSFFLVMWYQSWNSFDNSMITLLSNRFGDLFLVLATVGFLCWGWIYKNSMVSFYFSLLWVVACFTKSAQVPLSTWLPLAMSAPTPISALVHSSTLVTAGVFMILKFSILSFSEVFLFFSCITLILAGTLSLYEMDFKKIVALSTLSQLGLMLLTISFGATLLSFTHMMTHALMKSALFILVGVLLHGGAGSQDKRKVKFHGSEEILALVGMMVCSLSLCGLGFTSGMVSKEQVIFFEGNKSQSAIISLVIFMAVMFTLVYCFRMFSSALQTSGLIFLGGHFSYKSVGGGFLLVAFSIFLGWYFMENFCWGSPSGLSVESSTPYILLFFAVGAWSLTKKQHMFLGSSFGWSPSLKQGSKMNISISSSDRGTSELAPWKYFYWSLVGRQAATPAYKKSMFFIIYMFLFVWFFF